MIDCYSAQLLLFLYVSFRTVTLWRSTQTHPSMSTMLVTSGFHNVSTVAVAGILPSMALSAALLELLTVHSTCTLVKPKIFSGTATLKVTAITFQKEKCKLDSRLESAWQAISLLTPGLAGIQWFVSSLKKCRKHSSKLLSCDYLDFLKKTRVLAVM